MTMASADVWGKNADIAVSAEIRRRQGYGGQVGRQRWQARRF
jgi:hypothetical protein